MLPYTIKYNEFESDIQNDILLYKIHQQCQNAFEQPKISKNKHQNKEKLKYI